MLNKTDKPNGILSFFPKKYKPRQVQVDTLNALEKKWNSSNIFVVNLSVASGKSSLAVTIASWKKHCHILTPTKLLVKQYLEDYPYLHNLKSKTDYWCSTFSCSVAKRPKRKKLGVCCKKDIGCKGCNQYLSDLRKSRVIPKLLSNYYIYFSHKLFRDVLVVDEAHNLIPMLKEIHSTKVWQHQVGYPDNLTKEQLPKWAENTEARAPGMELLKEQLTTSRPSYLIQITKDLYHGREENCIKLTPLDIKDRPPFLWPDGRVKKIVLMSATLGPKDIEQLGLASQKVCYIQAPSPIEAEKRPVILPAERKSLSYQKQKINLPHLAKFIFDTANNNKDNKGLVHLTYGLAQQLKKILSSANLPGLSERLIYHTPDNKQEQYQKFRDSDKPLILIASGMYEGIDLPYDACRWQIIGKVPWPSLAEPAVKYLAGIDTDWYRWEATKITLQACGRVCRTLDDYGETFIFDQTFDLLYQNKDMFPIWFQQSVTQEDIKD